MKKLNVINSVLAGAALNFAAILSVSAAPVKVDIIFAMDTSGSMSNEASALVNSMNSVTSELSADFDLETKLWGITSTQWGLTSNVRAEVSGGTANHSEDWGPATYDLAALYTGWRSGAVKIVVPISDECPENGDGCGTDDETSVSSARAAADANNVQVLPIIGSVYNSSNTAKILQLAFGLSTNNTIVQTSSGVYADEMKAAIKEIIATVTGEIVGVPSLGGYYIQGNFIQIPISKAPGATAIEWEVTENGAFVSGQTATSISKISIAIADTQTHDYQIKARSVGTNNAGELIYSDYVETTAKYIGNFTDLSNECSVTNSLPQCNVLIDLVEEEAVAENPAEPESKVETKIGEVSDPIDVTTGNFAFTHTDIAIKTAGTPVIIKRSYNSLDIQRGWGFNIVNTMDTSDLTSISVRWGSGQTETFLKSEAGWSSKYGTSILYTESGFYTVELTDKTRFRFALDGKLMEVANKKSLGYKYAYSGNDITISDTFDNALVTIYRDSNLNVMTIEDAAGNSAEYVWNGLNLASYKNRNGDMESYEYDFDGVLYKIIGADGNAYVENTYDSQGRALSQKDGAGQLTQFSYDVDNNTYIIAKTTVTYPDGSVQDYNNEYNRVTSTTLNASNISYEYDANGKISKLTNQEGNSWDFKRNDQGQLTEYKDPLGNTYKYTYDADNNLVQTENPDGKQVSFEYDANQNLKAITYPDFSTKSFTYDANNQLTGTTNQLGNITNFSYGVNGFISTITLPNSGEMKYEYTALGQVSSVEDPLGHKTTYTYDNEGKLASKTDASANITLYAYNGYGDLAEITDANGGKTLYEYNTDGLRTKVAYADSSTIEYTYDVLGRLTETKDKLGRVSKQEYDTFGRLAKVTTPQGKYIAYQYDAVGNLLKLVDEYGNELSSEYNALGQATKKYDALSNLLTQKEYNALGLPSTITNGLGKNVKFQYDGLNRLTSSTLSDSITASAQYDALGQITAITDPKGNQTSYEYDELGSLVKETNSLGQSTSYSYDLYGRVTSLVDPNQVNLTYSYDNIGNITQLLFNKGADEESITYSYDKLSNPISITDDVGTISYQYDELSRVTQRMDVFGNTLGYAYDAIGRLATITYPDGKEVNYEYNHDDQLTKITDFNGNITLYEYDMLNNLVKTTYPNDFYTAYEYDSNHRLTKLQNFDKEGEVVTANTLIRDGIGNIINVDRKDYVGTDLSKVSPTNFVVNEANQIVSNEGDVFSYDENGNLLDYKIANTDIAFTYGLRDKISTATTGGDSFAYRYDAEGNRVEVIKNGRKIHFVIDNVLGLHKPLAEINASNAVQKYYIYGNGMVYALDTSGVISVYFYDYKGSTTAIVNAEGEVQNAYTYSSYGKVIGSSEIIENNYKYLGKHGVITDSDHHIYIRARYYSVDLGRFGQIDNIKTNIQNPLSLNRFRYTEGDPVNRSDLNGYWAGVDDFIAIVGGAVVGVVGQGVSDIISTAIETGAATYANGEFTFQGHISDWETYTGAAVGGAAAGETLLYTANPILAGAAGGLASSATKQGLYAFQGETTVGEAARDIATSTALGGLTGAIKVKPSASDSLSKVKVQGSFLTFNAETQSQIITGLTTGTTTRIGGATIRKLGTTALVDGLESGLPSILVNGVNGAIEESVDSLVLIPITKIGTDKRKAQ